MPRPATRAVRDKSDPPPAIWRIRRAESNGGDQSIQPARICHTVHAGEGTLGTVEAVARLQAGLLQRRQLAACGVGRGTVARRVRSGQMRRLTPSVFQLGAGRIDELVLCHAILLHAGGDCVLSHDTAAAIWGVTGAGSGFVHAAAAAAMPTGGDDLGAPGLRRRATVAGHHVRDAAGMRLHRVAVLDHRDVRLRRGLPVTAPARTFIDLAAIWAPGDVRDALGIARARGLTDDRELHAALDRAPLRPGAALLGRLIARPDGSAPTRSEFERRLLELVRAAGLPTPQVNATVNGREVDVLWPRERLILECDSWRHHGDRAGFERDRARDQAHLAAGWRVIRITWRQLAEEPLRVAAVIAAALAAT